MQTEKKQQDKKPLETSPRLLVLRKYLRIYSEVFSKEITPTLAGIFDHALADLSAEILEQACAACVNECRFMPTPADIRIQAEKITGAARTDLALIEWEAVVKHARRWSPDIGWGTPGTVGEIKAPNISAQAEWALRQTGGYSAISGCGYDDELLLWRKKAFDAAWARYDEMGKTGYTPIPEGEAQKILDKVPGYKQLMGRK